MELMEFRCTHNTPYRHDCLSRDDLLLGSGRQFFKDSCDVRHLPKSSSFDKLCISSLRGCLKGGLQMKPDTLEKVLTTLHEGDGLEGRIYFAKFDKTSRLALETALDDYGKRCIEAFFSWGEMVLSRLQDATFDYYKDREDTCGGFDDLTIATPDQIWQHCEPTNIHFVASDQDAFSTFVNVELECDWEPEHGMQWLVKNADELMYVGPYYGHASTDEKVGIEFGNYAVVN